MPGYMCSRGRVFARACEMGLEGRIGSHSLDELPLPVVRAVPRVVSERGAIVVRSRGSGPTRPCLTF